MLFVDDYVVAQVSPVPDPQVNFLAFFNGNIPVIQKALNFWSGHQSVGFFVEIHVHQVGVAFLHHILLLTVGYKKIFIESPVKVSSIAVNIFSTQQGNVAKRDFRVLHGSSYSLIPIFKYKYTNILSFLQIPESETG